MSVSGATSSCLLLFPLQLTRRTAVRIWEVSCQAASVPGAVDKDYATSPEERRRKLSSQERKSCAGKKAKYLQWYGGTEEDCT